ncbi:hypothetical protein CPY53_04585 [Paenibacillus polymyxa]|nr:hypothetical protein C1T20_22495 [Paenibacillus polymyxa]RFT97026.1 hypothetical protein DX902_13930 [Paenibacillus jamilae]UOD84885.1 hypothetical protein CUU60_06520 [Paenibacillus polymyxa ATCC 842]RGL35355.1 hypothetical protein DXC69_11865 [Paenibacillus polymyxa]RPE02649.1 hypothetical protein EG487_16350 [Paenibacillus polymyxa]
MEGIACGKNLARLNDRHDDDSFGHMAVSNIDQIVHVLIILFILNESKIEYHVNCKAYMLDEKVHVRGQGV